MCHDAPRQKTRPPHRHHIVYDACMEAYEKEIPLKDVLMKTKVVTDDFTEEEIDTMLNPEQYLGLAPYSATGSSKRIKNIWDKDNKGRRSCGEMCNHFATAPFALFIFDGGDYPTHLYICFI